MSPHKEALQFLTLSLSDKPRTHGLILPRDADISKWKPTPAEAALLTRPPGSAAAWGKATIVSELNTLRRHIEVQVFQDGRGTALVPCANAVVGAVAHFGSTWPETNVVALEPRSGYKYYCHTAAAGRGRIRVSSRVEFVITRPDRVDNSRGLITIDNYRILTPNSTVSLDEQLPTRPEDRLLDLRDIDSPKFYNHHGQHGAFPMTGLIVLGKLWELDLVPIPENVLFDGVPLKVTEPSIPGRRMITLPERYVTLSPVLA